MARNFDNWLQAFLEYTSYGEAPKRLYFWTAVSTIAGALRRHVWIDQGYFKWYPNHYIIVVAPPGIISKTTTTALGMDLLRKVPGINFGPNIVTWEKMVSSFAGAAEQFTYNGESITQSAITIESGEFGNLFDPKNRESVDLFVSLWDSKDGKFTKETKMSGSDTIVNPFINLIACTTPAWISENFPKYLVGGGFTSRCIFVYAESKHQYVAYPGLCIPKDLAIMRHRLVADLEHISCNLVGPYTLTAEAVEWGEAWYREHFEKHSKLFDSGVFGGYVARKQTHLHKLAMVFAAATSDQLVITKDHLETANVMITDLEPDMCKVFDNIGRSELSVNSDKVVKILAVAPNQTMRYIDLYRKVHMFFPSSKAFEDVMTGLIRTGQVIMQQVGTDMILRIGPNARQ